MKIKMLSKGLFSKMMLPVGLIFLLSACSRHGNAETTFWVRGNCEMCKATIETAVNSTPGVATAEYTIETHLLAVGYDSTKVNALQLHAACAAAGYETKAQAAVDQAYAALPKCCKKPADQ